jgi:uncharacterized protein (UPF0276 family)
MHTRHLPFLGVGLGFRQELKEQILDAADQIDFLELLTDQYIEMPPHKEQEARELAERFPIVLHGVDLSVGTDLPLDEGYVRQLLQVVDWVGPRWVSDHLSFTRVPGMNIGQLTPLSFTRASVRSVARNIRDMADRLDCPFAVENISYYFRVPPYELTEADFLTEVLTEADCALLLDLTNVQNNAVNNGYDPFEFLDRIPLDRVLQIHLAGGFWHKGILLDTHSHPVPDSVFDLLRYAAPRMPSLRAVMIERDQTFPPLEELLGELQHVRSVLAELSVPAQVGAAGDGAHG